MRRSLRVCCVTAVVVLLSSLASPVAHSHTSLRAYWLALPHAQEMDAEFTATLRIVSGTTAKYVVTTGNDSFTSSGTVRPGSPKSVSLPRPLRISSSETVENVGVKVTSNAPIGVTLFTSVEDSEAATGIQPAGLLGKDYMAVGYQESGLGDPSGFTSTMTIVGTRAGTSADVTPACTGVQGAPAGVKIDVELDAGETWQLRCDSSQDVTGSTVTSDEPLAVFGGNTCAFIVPGPFCDQVMEQMLPTGRWGRTFYLIPFEDSESDLVRFNTGDVAVTLTVTGTAPGFPAAMSPHAQVEVSLNNPVKVVTDKPIHIAQYMRGQSDPPTEPGDPSMLVAQDRNRWARAYRFVVPSGFTNKLSIVRPNGATVKLDGAAQSGFSAVPGGTHSYKTITVPPGQHVLRASAPVVAYVYGLGASEAYSFTAGVDPVKAGTKTTLSIDKTRSKVKGAGRVKPHGKGKVVVKLYRKAGGGWKLIATKRTKLSITNRYAVGFGRPKPGRCKLTARFQGDADHLPSSAKRAFRC